MKLNDKSRLDDIKGLPAFVVTLAAAVGIAIASMLFMVIPSAETGPAKDEHRPGYIRVVTKVNTFNGRVISVEYGWAKALDKDE